MLSFCVGMLFFPPIHSLKCIENEGIHAETGNEEFNAVVVQWYKCTPDVRSDKIDFFQRANILKPFLSVE